MSKNKSAAWETARKRWLRYVQTTVKAIEAGKSIPIGPSRKPLVAPRVSARKAAPATVVMCSPHPDDESLIGALALRFRQEAGARVVNCAITLGSNISQKARRLGELESACRALGFELIVPDQPVGLDRVNLANRRDHREEWAAKVETLTEIFEREIPERRAGSARGGFQYHAHWHALPGGRRAGRLPRAPRPRALSSDRNGILGRIEAAQPDGRRERGNPRSPVDGYRRARRRSEAQSLSPLAASPADEQRAARLGSPGRPGGAAQRYFFAELYRVTFMKGGEVVEPRPGSVIIGPKEKVNVKGLVGKFLPEGA